MKFICNTNSSMPPKEHREREKCDSKKKKAKKNNNNILQHFNLDQMMFQNQCVRELQRLLLHKEQIQQITYKNSRLYNLRDLLAFIKILNHHKSRTKQKRFKAHETKSDNKSFRLYLTIYCITFATKMNIKL